LLLVLVAALATGCGSATTVTVTVTRPSLEPPADQTLYGRPLSVERAARGYLLHFDPAFLTMGITANAAAAAADGEKCRPASCPPVPNDYFSVDSAHEDLVYVLPTGVDGTVLENRGKGPKATRITATQLATIVAEGKAPGITLFEPLDSGLWLDVHGDTIKSFDQQYRP
jgi:hypothetical protein